MPLLHRHTEKEGEEEREGGGERKKEKEIQKEGERENQRELAKEDVWETTVGLKWDSGPVKRGNYENLFPGLTSLSTRSLDN